MPTYTDGNYIRLYRKMIQWGWYTDVPVKTLFLHCLLKANWKESVFLGTAIMPGQFATSLKHLSEETGLTVEQVRYAIKKLKLTQELTFVSHGKFSVITINNWVLYQGDFHADSHSVSHSFNNNRRIRRIEEEKKLSPAMLAWLAEDDKEEKENGEFNEKRLDEN